MTEVLLAGRRVGGSWSGGRRSTAPVECAYVWLAKVPSIPHGANSRTERQITESLEDLAKLVSTNFSPIAHRNRDPLPFIEGHPFGENEMGVSMLNLPRTLLGLTSFSDASIRRHDHAIPCHRDVFPSSVPSAQLETQTRRSAIPFRGPRGPWFPACVLEEEGLDYFAVVWSPEPRSWLCDVQGHRLPDIGRVQ